MTVQLRAAEGTGPTTAGYTCRLEENLEPAVYIPASVSVTNLTTAAQAYCDQLGIIQTDGIVTVMPRLTA